MAGVTRYRAGLVGFLLETDDALLLIDLHHFIYKREIFLKHNIDIYSAFHRRVIESVVSTVLRSKPRYSADALCRLKIVEVNIPHKKRPACSKSKLRTLMDGSQVLWKIFTLFRALKPLTFFGLLALLVRKCLFGLLVIV